MLSLDKSKGGILSSYLSVKEAQQRILTAFKVKPVEFVSLEQANQRVLAQDIIADINLPPFDNSSMDGFAVRAEDVQLATSNRPVTLRVVADIPAGISPELTLQAGQTARIMTGAQIPKGADAVIPVEYTDASQDPNSPLPEHVRVFHAPQPGEYVRPAGQDVHQGEIVLTAGRRLSPQDIGLLASLGITLVPVHQKARVAILTTGDELVPPDQSLRPGKIRDSNSYTIAAMLETSDAVPIRLGNVPDDPQVIKKSLDLAVEQKVDLILTSAGVSVGTYDFVRTIIEEYGHLEFWRVNMRPGKPIAFGMYKDIPVVGLPGNPVSSFVGFMVFVRPILNKMAGIPQEKQGLLRVRLAEPVESDGRETYFRCSLRIENGTLTATLTGHQGSANLVGLTRANALLIVPSGVKSLPAGAELEAWPITSDFR